MSSPPTTLSCAAHPKRPGVTTCGSCGSGICRDCVVPTSVGMKCPRCTGVPAKAKAGAGPGVGAGASRGPAEGMVARLRGGERPPWLFPAVVAGVLVAGLVGMSLFSGGDEPVADPVGAQAADEYPLNRTVEIVGAGNLKLKGTLTLPVGRDPVGAVLVVPGFGSVDRDKVMSGRTQGGPADRLAQEVNLASSGATDPLFEEVVAALVKENLAALRYDKRGLGESRLPEGAEVTYDDVVADARAALVFLSRRAEVEGKPLVVLGYDQGAISAMRLSGDAGVVALVLVSPPGRPVGEVLSDHFVRTHGASGPAVAADFQALAGTLAANQPLPAAESISGHLRPLFPQKGAAYLRQVFAVNPVTEAGAVRVPALVLRGASDPTVTADDADRLKAALKGGVEVQVVAQGDHNLASEGVRERETLAAVASWVSGTLGA